MEAVSFDVPHLFNEKGAKYLSPGGALIAFLAVAQARTFVTQHINLSVGSPWNYAQIRVRMFRQPLALALPPI
jgi:ribose/xylose/arabinose/galactoside ABC-type transport system permease subunit